MPAKA
jgi:hypothetical protein